VQGAQALDAIGQGAVVHDDDGPRAVAEGAMLDGLDDGVVGRAAAGVLDLDLADVLTDGRAGVRHAVKDQ
jgi:hypothetical protein